MFFAVHHELSAFVCKWEPRNKSFLCLFFLLSLYVVKDLFNFVLNYRARMVRVWDLHEKFAGPFRPFPSSFQWNFLSCVISIPKNNKRLLCSFVFKRKSKQGFILFFFHFPITFLDSSVNLFFLPWSLIFIFFTHFLSLLSYLLVDSQANLLINHLSGRMGVNWNRIIWILGLNLCEMLYKSLTRIRLETFSNFSDVRFPFSGVPHRSPAFWRREGPTP